MAVAREFEYFRPETLEHSISLLGEYGENARVLAGGTDMALKIKQGVETPKAVVDIKGISELERLESTDNGLHLGALVTFSQVMASGLVAANFPLLRDAAATVGSVGIRNRATLVGSLCSAVPSLDIGPALLVHEAVVLTRSAGGTRKTGINKWFTGPKQCALEPGELVTGIVVPLPPGKAGGCYVKRGRYAGKDPAQAGVGILAMEKNDYRVAFCAVGPVAKRAPSIETCLHGQELTDPLIKAAQALVPQEISPITDIRASKAYRTLIIKVMLERGLKTAVSRLKGKPSAHGAIWI